MRNGKEKKENKMAKKIIAIILLVIILEIFVFNYQALESNIMNYKETSVSFEYSQNNNYMDIQNINLTTVKIKNINTIIHNIYIDYELENELENKHENETEEDTEEAHEELVYIYYSDEAFSGYSRIDGQDGIPSHRMIEKYNRSKYIRCNFIGKTKEIELKIFSRNTIKINNISINKKIPFYFNILRVLLLITIITGIYSLLNIKFFKNQIETKNYKQTTVLILIIYGFIFILTAILLFKGSAEYSGLNDAYKKDFIESLKSGKVNLELGQEALDIVNEVDNPYDYSQMEKYHFKEDKTSIWDLAYFNGKFYIYFGILPALILYLPANIIFGINLPISMGVFIFLVIGAIYTVKLLKEIITRYYKNIPISLIIIISIFMLFNNKLLWVMTKSQVYELVIAAGYCFVMAGLYMFFKYLKSRKKTHLFISCSLMALAVACRPTTLLISTIILVLLTNELIKKIKSKEKKEAINIIITAIIPYIIVGILLMAYNYIRFNNIFEFGANYQITITDIRKLGFNINKSFIGLTDYFLNPIKIIPEFPFVTSEKWQPEHIGYYFSEEIGGGYFTTSLIGLTLLLIPIIKNNIKKYNKEMYKFIITLITTGVILVIFTSFKGGSSGRYMMDFIWLFNMATTLIILFLYKNIEKEELKNKFIKALCIVVLISCMVNLLITFSIENYQISTLGIKFYYFIKYMLCFWI